MDRNIFSEIGINDFVIEKEKMWFASQNFNGLFEVTLLDGKITMLEKFPEYEEREPQLFNPVVKVRDILYFAPRRACFLAAFDLASRQFCIYKINHLEEGRDIQFVYMTHISDFLYLVPGQAKIIAKFDLTTKEFTYYEQPIKQLVRKYGRQESIYFRKGIEVIRKQMVLPLRSQNAVLIFDTETNEFHFHEIKISGGFAGARYDGKRLWLLRMCGDRLISIDEKGNILREIPIPVRINKDSGKYATFWAMELHGSELWLLPYCVNQIIKVNPDMEETEDVTDKLDMGVTEEESRSVILAAKVWENKLCMISSKRGSLICIEENEKREIKPVTDKELDRYLYRMLRDGIYYEEPENNLKDFMDFVINMNEQERDLKPEQGNYGMTIWKTLFKDSNGI